MNESRRRRMNAPCPPENKGRFLSLSTAICLAFAFQFSDVFAAQPSGTELIFIFRSRQGGDDLARALEAIRTVGREHPELMSPRDGARDKLPLDAARAMKVWPEAGKAPDPAFMHVFEEAYRRDGAAAFPAVKVEANPFILTLAASSIRAILPNGVRLFTKSREVGSKARSIICDPRYTFIEPDRCELRVSWTGLGTDPKIRTWQMGYTLSLKSPVTSELAAEIDEVVRSHVKAGRKGTDAPLGEVGTIRISRSPTTTDLGPSGQQLPQGRAMPPLADAATDGTHAADPTLTPYREIARALGMSDGSLPPAIVDDGDRRRAAPKVVIFDGVSPVPWPEKLEKWGEKRDEANNRVDTSPQCPDRNSSRHAEAVASLLFPPHPDDDSVGDLVGQFADAQSLLAAAYVSDQVQSLDQARGTIYLAPFAAEKPNIAAIRNFLATSLDENAVLVVSAPSLNDLAQLKQTTSNDLIGSGHREEYVSDAETLATNCQNTTWPACLGAHPRVIVVGPTSSPGGLGPTMLHNRGGDTRPLYALGERYVRVAAPGIGVGVVYRADPLATTDDEWLRAECDGTSFSAPLVALLLSRITQVQYNAGLDNSSLDPYRASMRLIATGTPLDDDRMEPEGSRAARLVGFGRIDARLALDGISKREIGVNGRATIHAEGRPPRYAVVAAYPWADVALSDGHKGLDVDDLYARGRLGNYSLDGGRPVIRPPLAVKKILRIHRTNDDPGDPVFDVYYLDTASSAANMPTVFVREGVRFGAQGFGGVNACDPLGNPAFNRYPACLYAWSEKPDGVFEPLDLGTIDDIVFPPFHDTLERIRGIDPQADGKVDLTKPARAVASPWGDALCRGTGLQPNAVSYWGRLWAERKRPLPAGRKSMGDYVAQLCESRS